MRRELDALDNKLQWGFEPGRWATGAAWHNDDWPEPKLLRPGELAGGFDAPEPRQAPDAQTPAAPATTKCCCM